MQIDAPPRAALDVLDSSAAARALNGVDTVIHAAGVAHVFHPTPATDAWMVQNVEGTRNVVAGARAAGVRRLVLISSVSVHSPESSGYARSKAAAERVAIDNSGSMTLLTLRLATVYGEGDPGNVLRLIRAIDRRRFIALGRGRNRKSLIHRDDAAAAIVTAALASDAEGVFDVSAPAVTMGEIVTTISRALGRRVLVVPAGDAAVRAAARAIALLPSRRAKAFERTIAKWLADDVYDGAPFCARFGFAPEVSLQLGLEREVAWYRGSRKK
jgi:UDP-glucose 4-epimerase